MSTSTTTSKAGDDTYTWVYIIYLEDKIFLTLSNKEEKGFLRKKNCQMQSMQCVQPHTQALERLGTKLSMCTAPAVR